MLGEWFGEEELSNALAAFCQHEAVDASRGSKVLVSAAPYAVWRRWCAPSGSAPAC